MGLIGFFLPSVMTLEAGRPELGMKKAVETS
jgi:hypothetical protein